MLQIRTAPQVGPSSGELSHDCGDRDRIAGIKPAATVDGQRQARLGYLTRTRATAKMSTQLDELRTSCRPQGMSAAQQPTTHIHRNSATQLCLAAANEVVAL